MFPQKWLTPHGELSILTQKERFDSGKVICKFNGMPKAWLNLRQREVLFCAQFEMF